MALVCLDTVTLRCRTRKEAEKQLDHYRRIIGKYMPTNLTLEVRQDPFGKWWGVKKWTA